MLKFSVTLVFFSGLLSSVSSSPQFLVSLTVGLALLTTFMISLMNYSVWLSYTLFIIFLGGVMVIFVYTSSVSPKEIFEFDKPYLFLLFAISGSMVLVEFVTIDLLNDFTTSPSNQFMNNFYSMKMFFYSSGNLFYIYLVLYLFFSLVCVVNLMKYEKGPLRLSN